MTHLKPFQLFLMLTGCVVAVMQVVYWLPNHVVRDTINMDFPVYYDAGKHALAGLPIYGEYPAWTVDDNHRAFFYPPPFAALMTVFARMSFPIYQGVWYALLLGAYWVYAAALGRIARVPVLVIGGLLILANTTSMRLGNVDLFVWALVAWALVLEDEAAAVLLVLGAAVKLYPVFPLAVVIARSRRPLRTLSFAALTAAVVLLATVATIGTQPFVDWLTVGLPSLNTGGFSPVNMSLSMAVLRLAELLGVVHFNHAAAALPAGARLFLTLAPIVAAGVVAVITRPWAPRVQTCAITVAAVWTAPLCWSIYAPLIALPLAVALGEGCLPRIRTALVGGPQ